jgi:hypothetical protein
LFLIKIIKVSLRLGRKHMSKCVQEIIDDYIKLGYTPEIVAITFSKKFRRHLYRIWKVFKEVYGYQRGSELYNLAIWGGGERVNYFKKEVEKRGMTIKNTKDIADILAYLHRECDNEPAFVTKFDEDEAIVEVGWCHNPAFSPRPWDLEKPDGFLDRVEFSYVDCYLGTVRLFEGYLQCIPGLEDKYEIEVAQTLNMGHPRCLFIVRKKGVKNES